MKRVLPAGALYFSLVFGAGFVLGALRVLFAVPRFGERAAELMETPVMLVVTVLAARWIVRRFSLPPKPLACLGTGLIALGLMLAAEFLFVLRLRGLTIDQDFESRDPVSGTVYMASLGLLAVMPLLVSRPWRNRAPG